MLQTNNCGMFINRFTVGINNFIDMNLRSGLIFAIISPLLNSIATILKGVAVKSLGPLAVLSFGSLLGAGILIFYSLLRKQKFSLNNLKDNSKDFFLLILTRPILGDLLFVFGLASTLGIKAIFLTKIEPYFVLFWHWILRKEKVTSSQLILLSIHIGGAVILSTGGNFTGIKNAQIGDLLIILAMGLFSLSYFPAKKVAIKIGATQTNGLMLLVSGLFFLPFVFLFPNSDVFSFFNKGWTYLVLSTIIFTTVGLTLWFASLKSVKSWIVSALRSLGPIAGLPFAYFLFGEKLSGVQLFGGIIVLSTSFLIAKEHFRKEKN